MVGFVEIFSYCILLITSLIGFSYMFSILERIILRSNNNIDMFIVLPVSGHIENIELLFREIKSGYNNKKLRVCFLDSGLDDETRNICKHLTKDFDNCIFCDENQLLKMLEKVK